MYFKSKKELKYDRFVDANILDAHSDLRIYRILSFLLDIFFQFIKFLDPQPLQKSGIFSHFHSH